jgi:GrpB-like predicted nucleotidyltransferase (UPF0157 family)
VTIGGPQPLGGPVVIADYDPEWPDRYAAEEEWIRTVLGKRVLQIAHVGSTSVPDLPAKPLIDIVLEVKDSAAEEAYAPDLVAARYVLRVREPEWFEHRLFKAADPDVNLHVFSAGCPEVGRMLLFRDRLRANAAEREFYAEAKRELAARPWRYMQQYADAKTAVVREIMTRAEATGGSPAA